MIQQAPAEMHAFYGQPSNNSLQFSFKMLFIDLFLLNYFCAMASLNFITIYQRLDAFSFKIIKSGFMCDFVSLKKKKVCVSRKDTHFNIWSQKL